MNRTNLLICLPARSFTSHTAESILNLQEYLYNKGIENTQIFARSANVYLLRDRCLDIAFTHEKNNNRRFTHILWIDSDIVFTPSDYQKLYNADKDIIVGFYLTDDAIHYAHSIPDPEKYLTEKQWYPLMSSGYSESYKDAPLEIGYAGFGFLLMKRTVLDGITYPHFRELYQSIGVRDEYLGEDFSFCKRCREQGIKIYAHGGVHVGHVKEQIL